MDVLVSDLVTYDSDGLLHVLWVSYNKYVPTSVLCFFACHGSLRGTNHTTTILASTLVGKSPVTLGYSRLFESPHNHLGLLAII